MPILRTAFPDLVEGAWRQRAQAGGTYRTSNTVQGQLEELDAAIIIGGGGGVVVTPIRLPAYSPSITFLTGDIEVGIDATSGPVSVNLPTVAAWNTAHPSGLDLTILDFNGQAFTNNITPILNGTDTFIYDGTTPVIMSNWGQLRLRPVLGTPNSWYIRALG